MTERRENAPLTEREKDEVIATLLDATRQARQYIIDAKLHPFVMEHGGSEMLRILDWAVAVGDKFTRIIPEYDKSGACAVCDGSGIDWQQDFYSDGSPARSVSEWPCQACNGRGMVVYDAVNDPFYGQCPNCKGTGKESSNHD
jgi:Fe-S cluster biogenesis protein NfuA